MNDEKLNKKILDRKLKLEKTRMAAIEAEKRMQRAEEELRELEQKAKDKAYKSLDIELSKKGIEFVLLNQKNLVKLISENQFLLIEKNQFDDSDLEKVESDYEDKNNLEENIKLDESEKSDLDMPQLSNVY